MAEAGYLSKRCWRNGHPKAKSEPQGKPHASQEGNSKWIMNENVKCELKLLGKMGENLSDLGLDIELLDITQRT